MRFYYTQLFRLIAYLESIATGVDEFNELNAIKAQLNARLISKGLFLA